MLRIVDEEAIKIMLSCGYRPLEPYPGSKKPWVCQCIVCNKIVSPYFSAVKSGKSHCKYCTGRCVDLDEIYKMMLDAELEPLEAFPGWKVPWKCKCKVCGASVNPWPGSIRRGGGCIYCGYKAQGLKVSTDLSTLIERKTKLYDGNVEEYKDCLIWTGCLGDKGYGSAGYQGKTWHAHRLIYTYLMGEIPKGVSVHHVCHNPPCCNINHLQLLPLKDNVAEMHERKNLKAMIRHLENRVDFLEGLLREKTSG